MRLINSVRSFRVALTSLFLLLAAAGSIRAGQAAAPAAGVFKPIRIHFGNFEPYTDPRGNVWKPDTGIEDGNTIERGDIPIANTDMAPIYRAEHYAMTRFVQAVPDGDYTVRLHFAETFDGITDKGQRVFSVKVQDKELKDLDIFAEVGFAKALIKTFDVSVTNGKLTVLFISNIENPEINGIEILPRGAEAFKPIRINAGATAPYTDPDGNVWAPDTGIEGGAILDRGEIAVANTKLQGVYRTEHYSMERFTQALPNGNYTVTLHFAETFDGISGKGQRVFSFKVQDKEVRDFDVYAESGGFQRAIVKTFDVAVTNGKLTIVFIPNIENPEINGIEILPARK